MSTARPPMPTLAAAYRVSERVWWEMSATTIVGLIAVLTAVRFFVAANVGLLSDEPYYWMWSQHLSAGYYDHPPMVAWWIAAGTAIFGDSPLGIRSVFVLNTAVSSFVVYLIGRTLFDERIGQLGALWANVTPLVGVAGFMATPDGPSVFFWTLAMLGYAMVVKTGRGAWWLAVGVFCGLGLLSKYTTFFLGLGIILSLLLDSRLRRWFGSPWLWVGGAIALILFLPVVAWNADNDWVSFRFQFGRLGEARFTPVYLVTLLIVQPLIFNPLAFVFVVRGVRQWLTAQKHGREIGILFSTTLPAVVFIIVQSTHGEVLQHWLAPVFPTLALVAVVAASTIPTDHPYRLWRRLRSDVVPFALTAAVVVWLYGLLPLDRYYPGVDPLNSMRGWPEFTAEVEAKRGSTGATWLATTDYQTTAQLSYELRDRAIVVPVVERARYGFMPPPSDGLLDQPALIVTGESDHEKFAEILRSCFGGLGDPVEIRRAGAGKVLATALAIRGVDARDDILTRGCDLPDG